jgi:uncharacterized membrane protein YhhN
MGTPYAHRRTGGLWMTAAVVGAGYGLFLLARLLGERMALPIWWAYAASLLLITAGFFVGRSSVPSATPAA